MKLWIVIAIGQDGQHSVDSIHHNSGDAWGRAQTGEFPNAREVVVADAWTGEHLTPNWYEHASFRRVMDVKQTENPLAKAHLTASKMGFSLLVCVEDPGKPGHVLVLADRGKSYEPIARFVTWRGDMNGGGHFYSGSYFQALDYALANLHDRYAESLQFAGRC